MLLLYNGFFKIVLKEHGMMTKNLRLICTAGLEFELEYAPLVRA